MSGDLSALKDRDMAGRKTVLISILAGVEAKNILRTDIVGRIARAGVRVVLLVKSAARADFYRKEFAHPNIEYAVVDSVRFSQWSRFFELLRYYLVRTDSLDLYKRLAYEERENRFGYAASRLATFLLARRPVRRLARFLDCRLCRDDIFTEFLDRYRPDAVFLANLFSETEASLLRSARVRGIRSVGFINSWDKLTCRGTVRLLPDTMIVPNEIVLDEALRYADMPRERIVVSGLPQYDDYAHRDGIISREAFFKKISMDPKLPLVIFCPMGSAYSNSDWEMIDALHGEITKKTKHPFNFFVRFQPNDVVEDRHRERPWLHYDVPGVRFGPERGMDWDMTFDELRHLKNTLYHASLFVSYASSIAIDAAYFDKPIINIGFEACGNQAATKMPTRRYALTHYVRGLGTGGIHMAADKEELAAWIDRYIERPETDRDGRACLVREQCWKTDGRAGERIAAVILGALG